MMTNNALIEKAFGNMTIFCSRWYLFLINGFVLLMMGCSLGTKPVIKIGLIAPFEGELSHIGYQRLYGVKLALQQVNQSGGVAGYKIELVALNDYGEPTAATAQIDELVIDPDVKATIGQWNATWFERAWPAYEAANLTVINPSHYTDFSALPAQFDVDFMALSQTSPADEAKQAYLATMALGQIIERAINQLATPTRTHIWQIFADMPDSRIDGRTK